MSMTTRVLLASGAALAVGCGLAGCRGTPPPAPQTDGPPAGVVSLTDAASAANPITTVRIGRQPFATDLDVVGSVAFDQEHYAVVGPLVAGRLVTIRARIGALVAPGELLAEIESPAIGKAQADYLAARGKARASRANSRRERQLASLRVSSVRESEVAEAQSTADRAEVRAAEKRLHAIGFTPEDIARLTHDAGSGNDGRVAIRTPIGGTVVARHVTLGQAVEPAIDAFEIGNLDHLWVLLALFEKDLQHVHVGQRVELRSDARPERTYQAHVAYVTPVVEQKTRTANVRIEFDNPQRELVPGQFVRAHLFGDASATRRQVLAVPRSAVQLVEGKRVVFVKDQGGGFLARTVEIGSASGDLVEVRSGLDEGDEVATSGGFLLKSELAR
jgi:cobalt-zinc-cadmium efflux system membrane fusion protein